MSEENIDDKLATELEEEMIIADDKIVELELSELEKLHLEIEDLNKKNKELENNYFKAYADAQNLSKRAKIDAENMVNRKISSILTEILPAIDNFERALEIKQEDDHIINFLKGFEMIYQQLTNALSNEGIEVIESLGLEFDPNKHQAIATIKDDNYASNIVVEEVQKGYLYKNKVIRPAMVKVNE
ncbi:MAG: nucleotide exchange factor GrpE [Bacilli bacterium]|nr:nucleotide exchange factor GrpE [Bacilli bacterium]